MCIAALVLVYKRGALAPVAPLWAYAAVSLSNVVATTCQYEALRYVSFPVQTLGKCGKMIPVMVWGRLMMGKRYGNGDYAVAAAVTLGATCFLMGGDTLSAAAKHGKHSAADTSIYGLALMGGYLGFDGFTSTFQDKLFKGFAMETYNQMLWVTACSAALSALWLLGDDTMAAALAFVARHPEALRGILALSFSSAIGQLFILHTIREFGALIFATVMTSRQFLSILLSCLLFMHPLSAMQWAGTVTIFSGALAEGAGACAGGASLPAQRSTTKRRPSPGATGRRRRCTHPLGRRSRQRRRGARGSCCTWRRCPARPTRLLRGGWAESRQGSRGTHTEQNGPRWPRHVSEESQQVILAFGRNSSSTFVG